MKFLIGAVPYGRNNVGDEAILATVVDSIRMAVLEADITISTDDAERTARKFLVRTVPLFGHDEPSYDHSELEKEMSQTDVFVWGGATGLSDYPHVALRILDQAYKSKVKVVLYSVGMNDQLNGAFFKLAPGTKKTICDFLSSSFFKKIDFSDIYCKMKIKWMKNKIKCAVDKADLIICRDESSKRELERCRVRKQIYYTADPAILLEPSNSIRLQQIWLKNGLWSSNKPIVGICISAQQPVKKIDDIVDLADYLVEEHDVHILFVPMNPKTDSVLMDSIHVNMKNRSAANVLTGEFEPEDIAAITSRMSLVISSRLHLLILSSISHIPLVGFSRGSKIDNFINLFGESTCGSVDHFNLDQLKNNCDRLLLNPEIFRKKAKLIVDDLQNKARENIVLFRDTISNSRG